jgi:hypothetical protein
VSAQDFVLTEEELKEITGYSRPAFQMKCLKNLGIPARRRPDNTLIVLRMDLRSRTQQQAATDGPKLKSSRK